MTKDIQIFEGTYNKQMPKLIAEGLKPATAKEIALLKLAEKLKWEIYYDSVTGTFYAGDNQDRFKILLFSRDLANVNAQTPLYNGGIEKTQEEYDKAKAEEFSRKDMILNQRLTEEQALKHLGWKEALGKVHEQYVKKAFQLVKGRYDEDKAMAFYLRNLQQKPNIRALCLDRLGYLAFASDGYCLDDDARLVGVLKKTSRGASQKLPYTPKQLERMSDLVRGVREGNLPASKLEKTLKFFDKLEQ